MFVAELARMIAEDRERELRGRLRVRELLRMPRPEAARPRTVPGLGRRAAAFLLARQTGDA